MFLIVKTISGITPLSTLAGLLYIQNNVGDYHNKAKAMLVITIAKAMLVITIAKHTKMSSLYRKEY